MRGTVTRIEKTGGIRFFGMRVTVARMPNGSPVAKGRELVAFFIASTKPDAVVAGRASYAEWIVLGAFTHP